LHTVSASPSAAPLFVLPFEERVVHVPSVDGVTAVAYDFGGVGQPFVIGHATGLHAHMYAPLIALLRERFHCYAVEVRGQGAATIPVDGNFSWLRLTEDFSVGLDALGLSGRGDVLGMGHSQGGYSVLSSALARPGTFAAIFAFEAVIMPVEFDQAQGDNLMAAAARRRREIFDSKQAAYDNFRAKPPFSGIDDDCLRAYVEYGFEANPDPTDSAESSVRLRCRASSEADLFQNARTHFFTRLGEITCPTTIGCSDLTGEHFKIATASQAEAIPHGRLRTFAGRSHFGPFERVPAFVSETVSLFDEMAAVAG
jgi:pimeloyl-ACP methyl ester carboxylesterase